MSRLRREALAALTTRGRAFLSSGVTALLCALALDMDDLARVGVLLIALPLLSLALTTRGRHRLGLSRVVTPTRVTVGQTAHVQLALSNEGRAPTGLLLLEEHVPYALGVRPRFVIDKMGPKWHRSVGYDIRSDVRGRFALGPMTVRVNDPFGLVVLNRAFQSTGTVVVTPEVVPLPSIPLSGAWTGTGEHRPRTFAGGSAEDVTTREYRQGDDLRRVHWRSSAHAGELMVRREEQPWQSRATLFLDNRRHVHRGSGAASSLEHAVTVAASIAVHLSQRGFEVRLASADGPLSGSGVGPGHTLGAAETSDLLEELAVVKEANRTQLNAGWLDDLNQGGLLVGIFGELGRAELPFLRRLRQRANVPLSVLLDVDKWGSDGAAAAPADSAERLLMAQGWRVVTAGPRDPLPKVWQELTGQRRTVDETGRAS